jgi:aryl-alcohol dehydrogenase-like predicted oxidoreductase
MTGPAFVGESEASPSLGISGLTGAQNRSVGRLALEGPMAPESHSRIPRRTIPPAGPILSLLGMTVSPSLTPSTSGDRGVVERLRRARAAGVTTFDVAASHEPARAERLLGQAFPHADPDLVVIVGRRVEDLVYRAEPGERAPAGSDGARERLARSLEDSGRRLAPQGVTIVEWSGRYLPELESEGSADVRASSVRLYRRLAADGGLPEAGHADTDPPCLVSGPLSLLQSHFVPAGESQARRGSISFLARDPFAGGRLDGTRAAMSGADRGPGAEPPRLRDLEAEYAPVLRLAFLTERRDRTLAQAAVRYAAHWPWVTSVLVPLPTVDRLEETLATFETPALSDEELRRVATTGTGRPSGP